PCSDARRAVRVCERPRQRHLARDRRRGRRDHRSPAPPAMTYVDEVILDLVERLCRRIQVLTGRTNVWLAIQLTNLSIVVYFVFAAAYFWISRLGQRILIAIVGSVVLYALTQTILKEPIELAEQSAYRRVAKGFRNPRRLRDAPLRISFLTLALLL